MHFRKNIITWSKCENEDEKLFEQKECTEILKTLVLIENT